MRLHTLQPLSALANLDAGFTYRPRPDLCERDGVWGMGEEIQRAYRWMIERLTVQDAPPTPNSLPVWAWHTYNPDKPGLDLRSYRAEGPGVLLELEVDPARVLLSDFDLWHYPLNGWHLGTEEECGAFEAECERRSIPWQGWWEHPDLTARVTTSWERCLDLGWHVPGWVGDPPGRKMVQGVLWEIRPEDVKGARMFKGRRAA